VNAKHLQASSAADRYRDLWHGRHEPPDLSDFLGSLLELPPRDLADVLLIDQSMRWRYGEAPAAEDYLAAHPSVAADLELSLDIAYGEYLAAQRCGVPLDPAVFIERFPRLREQLARQLEVSSWLQPSGALSCAEAGCAVLDAAVTVHDAGAGVTVTRDRAAPLTLDDFRLEHCLGRGGMGEVYRAVQLSLDKPVAIKMLSSTEQGNTGMMERLLREGRMLASLRHPNIVAVHGIGRTPDGRYFLVMDLVDGTSLEERVREEPLEIWEAVAIVEKVARAIDHAHARGVVHRDLKPGNVLLDADGQVKVVDFGLARQLVDDASGLSSSGLMIGTPKFMAPEQADPQRGEIGPRTDVYGLGAMLYNLLTGRLPVAGGNAAQVVSSLLSGAKVTPPRKLRPEIPVSIESVCLKCLQKDPAARFGSAREVEESLAAARGSLHAEPRSTPRSAQRSAGRWIAWISVVVSLAAVALFAAPWFASLLTETTSDVPPHTPPAASRQSPGNAMWHVTWSLDAFRGQRRDRRQRLTTLPGPVVSGDSVAIEIALSHPAFAYVFWIGSDGSVALLYPSAKDESETRYIALPARHGSGLPVTGPPGTEVCVLLVRDAPLRNAESAIAALRPDRALPALEPHTVLVDGWPVEPDDATAKLLAKLNDSPRAVGSYQPLVDGPAGKVIADWHSQLPAELGRWYYIAVPHAAASSGDP
jgi:serine/threonine protein kinase